MVSEHIVHSIPPTFDENSRVLVLGSIPSPKSREMQFNYGHPQNRFWRVLARIANEPVPSTNERKRDFCLRHHIALWDVLAECDIEGASDASIKNAKPNNLKIITDAARIEAVFCTGAKAHDLYRRLECEQTCGLPATKLPSTSPANAACSLEKLVEAYGVIFEHEHVWTPPTLDVPRVVELERQIDADGTSLAELMDRAGTALAKRVSDIIDDIVAGTYSNNTIAFPRRDNEGRKPTVTFLCGSGNNGGDGWVAAEKLIDNDIEITISKSTWSPIARPTRSARNLPMTLQFARLKHWSRQKHPCSSTPTKRPLRASSANHTSLSTVSWARVSMHMRSRNPTEAGSVSQTTRNRL